MYTCKRERGKLQRTSLKAEMGGEKQESEKITSEQTNLEYMSLLQKYNHEYRGCLVNILGVRNREVSLMRMMVMFIDKFLAMIQLLQSRTLEETSEELCWNNYYGTRIFMSTSGGQQTQLPLKSHYILHKISATSLECFFFIIIIIMKLKESCFKCNFIKDNLKF